MAKFREDLSQPDPDLADGIAEPGRGLFSPDLEGILTLSASADHDAALGRAIQARGIERVFLQVEEANDARSLYRKAGFEEAWRYFYWTR